MNVFHFYPQCLPLSTIYNYVTKTTQMPWSDQKSLPIVSVLLSKSSLRLAHIFSSTHTELYMWSSTRLRSIWVVEFHKAQLYMGCVFYLYGLCLGCNGGQLYVSFCEPDSVLYIIIHTLQSSLSSQPFPYLMNLFRYFPTISKTKLQFLQQDLLTFL